jgi:hypothetical protein
MTIKDAKDFTRKLQDQGIKPQICKDCKKTFYITGSQHEGELDCLHHSFSRNAVEAVIRAGFLSNFSDRLN